MPVRPLGVRLNHSSQRDSAGDRTWTSPKPSPEYQRNQASERALKHACVFPSNRDKVLLAMLDLSTTSAALRMGSRRHRNEHEQFGPSCPSLQPDCANSEGLRRDKYRKNAATHRLSQPTIEHRGSSLSIGASGCSKLIRPASLARLGVRPTQRPTGAISSRWAESVQFWLALFSISAVLCELHWFPTGPQTSGSAALQMAADHTDHRRSAGQYVGSSLG